LCIAWPAIIIWRPAEAAQLQTLMQGMAQIQAKLQTRPKPAAAQGMAQSLILIFTYAKSDRGVESQNEPA